MTEPSGTIFPKLPLEITSRVRGGREVWDQAILHGADLAIRIDKESIARLPAAALASGRKTVRLCPSPSAAKELAHLRAVTGWSQRHTLAVVLHLALTDRQSRVYCADYAAACAGG